MTLAACGAPAGEGRSGEHSAVTGIPVRVAFRDYRSNQFLELVNESHTPPVEQYSKIRSNAARKVQSDEVMEALLDYLRERGWQALAREGPAPAERGAAGAALQAALEVERSGEVRHAVVFKGQDLDARTRIQECVKAFADTYNLTYSLQTVELKPGDMPFQNPVGPTRVKDPVTVKPPGG